MNTKRQGIQQFLTARQDESPFLIPKWTPALETQYNVLPGSAEDDSSDEDQKVWTDGEQTWCHHRWPHKAKSAPYYKDSILTFSPGAHLDRIGSTWWNWEEEESWAIGFDIDVESANHKQGITKEKLIEIVDILKGIPYVTLVKSTGGEGVHGYVFFKEHDRPKTKNHSEHTQVALAVINKLCKDADYDFLGQKILDVTGVVLWFWSHTSGPDHPGFTVIQEATHKIGASDIGDWKTSVSKKYYAPTKKRMEGYTETGNRVEEATTEYEVCQLDDAHREILKELEDLDWAFIWNGDYNMAHTHTCALKELFEKRHKEGRPLRGLFKTISAGNDPSKPNCYLSPRKNGVFRVARFGNGTMEHASWSSYEDKTWTFLNQDVDVLAIMEKFACDVKGSKFVFKPADLQKAMISMGQSLMSADQILHDRHIDVLATKEGLFVAVIAEHHEIDGWRVRGKGITCELPVAYKEVVHRQNQLEEADKMVRHLRTPNLEQFGWSIKTTDGTWTHYVGYNNVSCVVKHRFGKGSEPVKNDVTVNPWTIVHKPFKGEYPKDPEGNPTREWNWQAPQLSFKPADDTGPCPHFDMIMDHLGQSLTPEVVKTEWCNRWGMHTGADYLRFWIASVIKCPNQPLPYLFFCGPQNSGKSVFFEMLDMLFTKGVMSAESALTGDFNAELANAVVAYIDEKNLNEASAAATYSRLKEWITARKIPIHKKGFTPYAQENTLHFVHCANSSLFLPIEDGDTRITVIEVTPIANIIPKAIMEEALEKEAPFFLKQILDITIPEPIDRLRIPVLQSSAKQDLERINMSQVEICASDVLKKCPGAKVRLSLFYDEYKVYCTTQNKIPESITAVNRQLKNRSDLYLIGRGTGNQTYIGNVTTDEQNETPSLPLILNDKGRLVKG